jgi:hypothetical protein
VTFTVWLWTLELFLDQLERNVASAKRRQPPKCRPIAGFSSAGRSPLVPERRTSLHGSFKASTDERAPPLGPPRGAPLTT